MNNFLCRSVVLMAVLQTVLAMEFKNCQECSMMNSGRNFMCDFDGQLPTEEYNLACCEPNDPDPYCQTSETNTCSGSYQDTQHNFFTYCPLINSTGCSIYTNDMVLEASTANQTFSKTNLRYKDAVYKIKTVDACYYQVQNPTLYYTSGSVYLKFPTIEDGVQVYLNAGSDVRNSSVALVDNNSSVKAGDEFIIDQSLNYVITTVPRYNSYNTSFTFEYYTDGVEYEWYELYYFQFFVKNPNGEKMLYIAIACAAMFVCVYCCCFGCCIYRCCCKKTKVGDFSSNELTASGYEKNKDGNKSSMPIHELASMSSDVDDSHTMAGDTVLKKESKAKRDAELKDAYSNPFKQQNIDKNRSKFN